MRLIPLAMEWKVVFSIRLTDLYYWEYSHSYKYTTTFIFWEYSHLCLGILPRIHYDSKNMYPVNCNEQPAGSFHVARLAFSDSGASTIVAPSLASNSVMLTK